MPTVLVETSLVDGSGNAYVDGSNNAYVIIAPTTVTSTQQPGHIPGAEWQVLDWQMEVNRLKSWWG